MRLGINVDHVATVREARKTDEPDPVRAAVLAELGGADGITVHLRLDRRHIRERDVELLLDTARTGVNLELAAEDEVLSLAEGWRPEQATLVPERRQEVTTEGGLDVAGNSERIGHALERFHQRGIPVSLFIDPENEQLQASSDVEADFVELHTGGWANADRRDRNQHLKKLTGAAASGRKLGLTVNVGHGLTYDNVTPIVQRINPHELHIGHSIVARSVFVGIRDAVRQMKDVIHRAEVLSERMVNRQS